MADFLDLVRSEHQRQQEIQKSHGRIVRPPEQVDENPFVGTVMKGLQQRFQRQRKPAYRGTKVLNRRPTFTDAVCASAAGLDVRQRDAYDDWVEGSTDLADIDLSDLAEWLSGDV